MEIIAALPTVGITAGSRKWTDNNGAILYCCVRSMHEHSDRQGQLVVRVAAMPSSMDADHRRDTARSTHMRAENLDCDQGQPPRTTDTEHGIAARPWTVTAGQVDQQVTKLPDIVNYPAGLRTAKTAILARKGLKVNDELGAWCIWPLR